MHAPSSLRLSRSCGQACSAHTHQQAYPRLPLRAPYSQAQRRDMSTAALGSAALSTVVVAAFGAYYLSRQVALEEQGRLETSRRPCPSCGGSGYESCMCTRWSDGDVGCNTCSHTGYMKCRSCGGRGTAVPIKVTIRKNDTL